MAGSLKFNNLKCLSSVMGSTGQRGLWNRDAVPEVALLWDIIKTHYRAFPEKFDVTGRSGDVMTVIVRGLLDFGIDILLHFNIIPGTMHIASVKTKWNGKIIDLVVSNTEMQKPAPAPPAQAPAPAPPAQAPAPAPPAPAPAPAPPAPAPAPPAPEATGLPPPGSVAKAKSSKITMAKVREMRAFKEANPAWSVAQIVKHFDITYNVGFKMLKGHTYKEE